MRIYGVMPLVRDSEKGGGATVSGYSWGEKRGHELTFDRLRPLAADNDPGVLVAPGFSGIDKGGQAQPVAARFGM
jgi:hypothetical protein